MAEGKCVLKRQAMTDSQKRVHLSLWKRLILIAGILLPGVSLAMLAPSQAAYAEAGWPQAFIICRAAEGGHGGIAINGSNGANGAPGGDCAIGPHGGAGAPGGDHGSPGGNGGAVIL